MADSGRITEKKGAFQFGEAHDWLGTGLGNLYEAWKTDTGSPVLLLRPGADVEWQPEGPLQIQLRFHPENSTLSVEMQAPAPPDLSDVANILVLTTAAVTRVEDHPQVRAHVASRPRSDRPALPPRREPHIRRGWMLAGLAGFAMCMGVCLFIKRAPMSSGQPSSTLEPESDARVLSGSTKPNQPGLAYPLPTRPFRNQAKAPCYPELDEMEINGGCWTTLKRRPPCLKDIQAEYKGECFLPISKDRDRGDKPNQSVAP